MPQTALPMPQLLASMGGDKPFAPLVERWLSVIDSSVKDKEEKWTQWANEAMQFFDGPLNWMWKDTQAAGDNGFLASNEDSWKPQFLISVNRLFEAVSMFVPVLYHQNPTIAVTHRRWPKIPIESMFASQPELLQVISQIPMIEMGAVTDPMTVTTAQQLVAYYEQTNQQVMMQETIKQSHAAILEAYSNWLQLEGDKKSQARRVITEAILTGLGLMETEPVRPPGGQRVVPTSRYRSAFDLFVDPDARYWEDVTWIALKTVAPVNQVEAKYGLAPGTIKATMASGAARAGQSQNSKPKHGDGKPAGITHDLCEYYEIYSKNGCGQHLLKKKDKAIGTDYSPLSELGDFCYLVVAKGYKGFLNISDETIVQAAEADAQAMQILAQLEMAQATGAIIDEVPDVTTGLDILQQAVAWPVPYWADEYSDGGWPVCRLSFHDKPREVWPISMCKACIGELRFVNWCMSFLADRVAAGSKTYMFVLKEAAATIRDQIVNQTGPFSIVELEKILQRPINEIVQMLQAPSYDGAIWQMVAEVNEMIDKRLGLTELRYGMSSKQMRSAAEAQYRQQNIDIRPDDMAGQVEDFLSRVATREIQAMRWACRYDDVVPVLGPIAAQVFETQILTQDVEAVTRDYSFRVQAGTARKPNKDTRIAQLSDLSQYLLPVMQPLVTAGVIKPFNALITDLAAAMELDATPYLLGQQEQALMIQMQQAARGDSNGDSGSESGKSD